MERMDFLGLMDQDEMKFLNDYCLGRLNAVGIDYRGDSAYEYLLGRCDEIDRLDGPQLECGPDSKRCGKACIPKWKKCRASWNKPVKLAAGAAALTGAVVAGTAFFHPRSEMRRAAASTLEPLLQSGFALGNTARGNTTGAVKNVVNAATSGQDLGKNAKTLARGYGEDLTNVYKRTKSLFGHKNKPNFRVNTRRPSHGG